MAVKFTKVLGDLRAEHDLQFLERAFLETPDYKLLAALSERPIVVGRRGTGKSAIAYRLRKDFDADTKALTIDVAPSEDQIIGLRPLIELFGQNFNHIRAGAKIAWKFAILMEIVRAASSHYRFGKTSLPTFLIKQLELWDPGHFRGRDISFRLRSRLKIIVDILQPPASRIGELAAQLCLQELEEAVPVLLEQMNIRAVVLADRLDEGYEPDDVGVGLVAGFVQATVDLNTRLERGRIIIFLRDNIYQTIARNDPDFSRNIEGQVIRLHWDDHLLLNLVAERIRIAMEMKHEQSIKVWNACVAEDLRGMDGFRKCLRLTLYRPRDLLSLLNEAFLHAKTSCISLSNVEATAESISISRLDDLRKEYRSIFPSIDNLVDAFHEKEVEVNLESATQYIEIARKSSFGNSLVSKDLEILGTTTNILRALYSVGFLGIREPNGSYVFCHDGKKPDRGLELSDRLLIHPCYWMGLNLQGQSISREQAAEIHDEYSIAVASATPEIRAQRLGQLISELGNIQPGREHSSLFEDWCLEAIRIIYAGSLTNVELHPNKTSTQRRDVVASNAADSGVWRRIIDDYSARQVLFEVKNYSELTTDDYRQINSYLGNMYGSLGFLVTRGDTEELLKDKDLRWIRELYNTKRVLVVRITAEFLRKRLAKLRSPQKHYEADQALGKLLDRYERLYLSDASVPVFT